MGTTLKATLAIVVIIVGLIVLLAVVGCVALTTTTTIVEPTTSTCFTTSHNYLIGGPTTYVQCNEIVIQNSVLSTQYSTVTSINVVNNTK